MSSIVLRNVYKRYGKDSVAVKDFSLEVKEKEFLIFVGPSGCGKSTTLRMIAGLEEITEGELWIGEELSNFKEPRERDLSMVFQSYALYPHMTVYKNLAFPLSIRKVQKSEIDKQVREVAKILEIEHLLERRPANLSGGQKQRVAIGSAIIRKPKAFLMDEPLSNLDAKLRNQMRVELAKLHKKLETTIIYVTHDQVEAMTLGTRIVVMKDGIIQQVATPEVLYNHPANKFVAGFIGSPPMNFINVSTKEGFVTVPKEIEQDKVCLGIRAEDFTLEEVLQDNEVRVNRLCGEVVATELLGAEKIVYFLYEGTQMTMKVEPDTQVKTGDYVVVSMDMNRVKYFDMKTEENLFR